MSPVPGNDFVTRAVETDSTAKGQVKVKRQWPRDGIFIGQPGNLTVAITAASGVELDRRGIGGIPGTGFIVSRYQFFIENQTIIHAWSHNRRGVIF